MVWFHWNLLNHWSLDLFQSNMYIFLNLGSVFKLFRRKKEKENCTTSENNKEGMSVGLKGKKTMATTHKKNLLVLSLNHWKKHRCIWFVVTLYQCLKDKHRRKKKKRRKNKLKQVWVSNIVEHLATRNNTQPHTTQMERPEQGFLVPFKCFKSEWRMFKKVSCGSRPIPAKDVNSLLCTSNHSKLDIPSNPFNEFTSLSLTSNHRKFLALETPCKFVISLDRTVSRNRFGNLCKPSNFVMSLFHKLMWVVSNCSSGVHQTSVVVSSPSL